MRYDPNWQANQGMATGQAMPKTMAPTAMPMAPTVMPTPTMQTPVTAQSTGATGSTGTTGGNMFGNFLGKFGDWLGNNAGNLATIGSIAGALDNASDVRDMGYAVQQHLENMGYELNDGSQFQGYGVTTGLGQSNVGADGGIDFGVNPNQYHQAAGDANMAGANSAFQAALGQSGGQGNVDWNAIAQSQLGASQGIGPNQGYAGNAAQDAMGRSLADPSQRQQEIFQRLMDIQNPMLDQQQAQQQAREHAMGRGGIAGSAYGGTAEDAAMAKARAMAANQAAVDAMQQADSERSMFGQMASQYGQLGQQNYQNMANRENALAQNAAQFGQLGNQAVSNATQQAGMLGQIGNSMAQLGLDQQKLSYLPMQQQLEILKAAQGTGAMAQQGQLTGQDYLAQMLLGGTNANVNAQKVSSELMGNLYNSLLSNMGGTTNADGSGSTGIGRLFKDFSNLFKF